MMLGQDAWDAITARRAAAAASAPDDWSGYPRVELPTTVIRGDAVDSWGLVEARRGAETAPRVSHAKILPIFLAVGGVFLLLNLFNGERPKL